MPSPSRRLAVPLAALLLLAACAPGDEPFSRLSGVLLDRRLGEVSGLAVSRTLPDVLWMLDDGGNAPELYAVSPRGRRLATFPVRGVSNTDWEDLAAFELDGRHYLLVADIGDNGGLRRSLQLHVVPEPDRLDGRTLRPAWSIVFRWPDGARDCEAVAVDARRGRVLLVSKKRRPPELFALPLRPAGRGVLTASLLGRLRGVPRPDAAAGGSLRDRVRHQVTAADLSPDGATLAVLTYDELLLYPRGQAQSWGQAVAAAPRLHPLPWLPQAEALGWSRDGRHLYATGEFTPAPLLLLTP